MADSVVLVSCSKSKRGTRAPARELYNSAWFTKVRGLVEARGARWYILSARHGLLHPQTVVEPYDCTLARLSAIERRAWASKVLDSLWGEIGDRRKIILFAGLHYREHLVGPLIEHGLRVEVPLEGLRQGEQLSWLAAAR